MSIRAIHLLKNITNVHYTEISYADHGFFCDEKAAYNPKAAAEAWALTLAFLEQNIYSK